jgi:hypothetical protein
MGDVVNLRRARKDRARRDADSAASANRAAFGRTRAEKDGQRAVRNLEARKLDGHRLDLDGADSDRADE